MKNRFLIGMIAFYSLGAVSGFALFGVLDEMRIPPKENWMICFDAPSTQETFCGPHRFDNIDSCVEVRDWLRKIVQDTWQPTDQAVRNHRCNRAIEK